MGLFINHSMHPEVFKNKSKINASNQMESKSDFLSEWMDEQRKAFALINVQFHTLEKSIGKQEYRQISDRRTMEHRFDELAQNNSRQLRFENEVLHSLKKLDTNNRTVQRMLTNGRSLDWEFLEQMTEMRQSTKEITNYLTRFDKVNEELTVKIDAQVNQQKLLASQVAKQATSQGDVFKRLDHQEGLMEKLLRQMEHIRSVLFERAHFLAEKIEKVNKYVSTYPAKLKTGSEQSLTLHKMDEKQKDKESMN